MTSDKFNDKFTYFLGLLLSGSGVSESEFSSSEPDTAASLIWKKKNILIKNINALQCDTQIVRIKL